MDPTELFGLAPELADHSQHFAVERQFVNAARIGIRAVQVLGGAGVMQIAQGAPLCRAAASALGWLPIQGSESGGTGTSMTISRRKAASESKHLDAAVAAIGHVDVAVGVGGNAVRRIEFARLVAGSAPTA